MADAADAFQTRVATAARPAWEVGSTPGSAARFQILRPHASGGLGEVFIARDKELNRDVALKEIHARYADNEEVLGPIPLGGGDHGRLEHPGIVPVYGLGSTLTAVPTMPCGSSAATASRRRSASFHDQHEKPAATRG